MPGINYSAHQYNPIAQGPGAAIAAAKTDGQSFGFSDLLAIANPLQHIPVISTLYRHLTGDSISPAAKVVGDTLYGGPLGMASSMGDLMLQKLTGKGVGDTVYAMAFGDDTPTTGVASADTPVAVKPASSEPDAATITLAAGQKVGTMAEETADIVSQQVTKAYRTAGRLIAAD
ncbi:MAG: hypothetical protein P4L57_07010 [Rhizomicrobium sp.]|nr:hypothetical protein [Rhizomicrobium sp.]